MTTLLAVDDSKTMRQVLEMTFSGEELRTVTAETADEALNKLRSERPSVALVDAVLGDQSGYDLCQRIKSEDPQVSVIMLCSKHQPYDRNLGARVGADDFVDKPFDTQHLIDKVSGLAQRRPAPRAVAERPSPGAPQAAASQEPPAGTEHRAPARTLSFGAPAASPAPEPKIPRIQPRAPVAPASGAPRVPAAAAEAAGNGAFAEKLGELGLTSAQVEAVLALSREVVEQVVWEVVPQLAETMIQEEIRRLTGD